MSTPTTTQTTCPYCGVGCGVIANRHENGSFSVKGDKLHPANYGRLCSKGSALADTIGLENRLLYPEINGERVSWNKALDAVAEGFKRVIDQYGSDAVAFYVSGQLLTEDYYIANKLMKGFIGSGNIDTNSRLCMSSVTAGYKRAFGSDSMPCNYEDLEQADLIVIEGSNAAWCHPVVYQRISKAKQVRPELKIIVIDPRRTATCDIADLHLSVQSGTDTALFNGLLQYLHQHGHVDHDFVTNHVDNFDEAIKASVPLADIDAVADYCGIDPQDIARFYQLFAETEKVVTLYSQGVNQSSSGTDNSNSIINCHLATGRIGKPAMGPFSITGQPNAMGGREVGALSNQLAAHMDIENSVHHDLVSRFWQTNNLATKSGAKAVDMFDDVASGKIKAIWIMATNPAASFPNNNKVREALDRCDLVVVSDCESKTDTMQYADIVLPALTWGEKEGMVTNSERRISHQRAFLEAPVEAKADWWIISQVAYRLGFTTQFNYQSSADIFREHAALSGFENDGVRDFDISGLADISDDEYEHLQPIQWPINRQNPQGCQRLFTDKRFFTQNGRAKMLPITPHLPENSPNTDYPLILNTGRIRDQWHTMTRTARSAKLNGHYPEPIIEVHPSDAEHYQLQDNSLAQIDSLWGTILARVTVSQTQRKGSVFVPMHWNEQFASLSCVGTAVNPVVDPISGQPESKHTPVRIKSYQAKWYGFVLSRTEIEFDNKQSEYWIRVKGDKFWRYELAGESTIDDAILWLKGYMGQDGDRLEFYDSGTHSFRIAKIKNNQLEMILFIAKSHDLPARSWLSQLFSESKLIDDARSSLLVGKPGAGQPDVGPMVCACFGIGENTITDVIRCGNAKSVDDIGKILKAGTNCGSCIPELKRLLIDT